jgi:hypothetical protein
VSLDYPNSPTVGQIFSGWRWDGVKWVPAPGTYAVYVGDTAPTSPVAGALWWDSVSGNLFVYYSDPNSNEWVAASRGAPGPTGPPGTNVTISDTPPANPQPGQLWWDSTVGQFFVYFADADSSQWVVASQQGAIGPQGATGPAGPTGPSGPNTMPQGVTDGSNAAAGQVGEVIANSVTGSSVPTNATVINLVTITLSPGDWDVFAMCFLNSASAVASNYAWGISTTSATLPAQGAYSGISMSTSNMGGVGLPVPPQRYNVTAATTLYLVCLAVASSGTVTGNGSMYARRMR